VKRLVFILMPGRHDGGVKSPVSAPRPVSCLLLHTMVRFTRSAAHWTFFSAVSISTFQDFIRYDIPALQQVMGLVFLRSRQTIEK